MTLKYIFAKVIAKSKPNAVRNCKVDKRTHLGHGNTLLNSSIGKYTYIGNRCSVVECEMGNFCSVAGGVSIGGGAHPLDRVSSSPVFHSGRNILRKNFASFDFYPYKKTVIGSDVWIGSGCKIKGGVTIGTGAVIGMGSVLTHDVPPYEIWAGNPAKLIRKRFDDETIEALLKTEWWNLSDQELEKCAKYFDDPEKLIAYFEENK